MALDLTALTNPYGQELAGIERNRALATALMQGGQQQPQGQMISGRYVAPSLVQNFAPLLQTAAGLYGQTKADEQSTKLAAMVRGKQAELLDAYGKATTPQEQFAIGTNPYAPAALQAATWKKLEAQKLGKGDILSEFNIGTGQRTTTAEGAPDLPAGYTAAMWEMGIKPEQYAKLNPEQRALIGNRAGSINQSLHPKTIVNVSDIMGKDIGQIKDLMEAGRAQVQAGELSINAANKIDKALKSGNLSVGPTATVGQSMGQLGDSLGLVNQKGQEKLVNTRQAIQGLAQMWASARQQAKGQGTLTEGESQLYGKISSGDLNSISIPELKYMVESTKSQGNYFRQEYENKLNVLKKNPKFADVVPFYEVGSMPSVQFNESPITQSQTVNDALKIIQGGAKK